MRFTITINGRSPPNLRWGVYNRRDAIDQAEGLVARGTRGVKITTDDGRSFDLDEFRRFIRRLSLREGNP